MKNKFPKDLETSIVLIVLVQFVYMTRKNLKIKEHFFDRLYENIRQCGFDTETENELLAMAVLAAGSKRNYIKRLNTCFKAMDVIYSLAKHGMDDDE